MKGEAVGVKLGLTFKQRWRQRDEEEEGAGVLTKTDYINKTYENLLLCKLIKQYNEKKKFEHR